VANQISADVSKVVEENDSAALTMHNLLQAYLSIIIEAKVKHPETVEQLQNTQPALQIKELLQQFRPTTGNSMPM
jgi:ABC-type transporter Mla subunit MlaD